MVHAPSRPGTRSDAGGIRRCARPVPHRAAAVLPRVKPPRTDGRPVAARSGQHHRHRAGRVEDGSQVEEGSGREVGHQLHRRRQPAFLPAARRAAAQHQLWPADGHDQRHRSARARARTAPQELRDRLSQRAWPRVATGERPTRRLSGATARLRSGPEEADGHRGPGPGSAAQGSGDPRRQHQRGRAPAVHARDRRPGQGACAGTHFQADLRRHAGVVVGPGDHPIPRRRPVDRRRRAGGPRRTYGPGKPQGCQDLRA